VTSGSARSAAEAEILPVRKAVTKFAHLNVPAKVNKNLEAAYPKDPKNTA